MTTTNNGQSRAAVLQALSGHAYINLETYKRSGAGVKTPIWFVELDGALAFFTNNKSWKVKRLARNPACKFAACGVRGAIKGPWFEGSAALVDDSAWMEAIHRALRKKYGLQMKIADVGSKVIGSNDERAFYRVDIPD